MSLCRCLDGTNVEIGGLELARIWSSLMRGGGIFPGVEGFSSLEASGFEQQHWLFLGLQLAGTP